MIDYVIERVLNYLDSSRRNVVVPQEVADIYDEKTYVKQQNYEKAKSTIGFWTSTICFLLVMALFVFEGYGILDKWIAGGERTGIGCPCQN